MLAFFLYKRSQKIEERKIRKNEEEEEISYRADDIADVGENQKKI